MTSLSPSVIQIADALDAADASLATAIAAVADAVATDPANVHLFVPSVDNVTDPMEQVRTQLLPLRALLEYVRTIDAPPA